MSWTFVIRPREIDTFRSCQRAWDFGARVRRNLVPVTPPKVFDFDKAMRIGLAVYYFPAMDDWNRAIVRPLGMQGFERAMREDRAAYERSGPLTPEQDREWHELLGIGARALDRYFDWAKGADDFESILADEDIWVPVPDPWNPGLELGTPDERPVRYFGRIDQLISDAQDRYWVVRHRVVWDDWEDDETLVEDEHARWAQWSVELSYPQLVVAGTIYNELRVTRDDQESAGPDVTDGEDLRDMTRGVRHLNYRRSPLTPEGKKHLLPLPPELLEVIEEAAPESGPPRDQRDRIVKRDGNEFVRRTHVRRAPSTVAAVRTQMAEHVLAVRDPGVEIVPNPSEDRCPACAYRKPCTMQDEGLDIAAVLAREYRARSEDEFEEEGLRWSPDRRARRASLGGVSGKPATVNFRWG